MAHTSDPPGLLVLTSTYPRWQNDTMPAFVAQLSQQQAKCFQVDVLAPHYAGASTFERVSDRLSVRRYRYAPQAWEKVAYGGGIIDNLRRQPWLIPVAMVMVLAQLLVMVRLMRRNRYSCIHAHWLVPQGIIACLYKWAVDPQIRVVVTSHGADFFALQGWLWRKLKAFVINQADVICVVSQAMREECLRQGVPEHKVTVASMGVDLSARFVPPVQNTESASVQRRHLLFVGRLVPKKGVDVLLQAMPEVLKQHPDEKLLIVGDGPERGALESLCRELAIDGSVEFSGPLPPEQVPEMFRQARLAIVPSVVDDNGNQEGLGLVAVEALGCQCPVVASALPALKDVIEDGHTGLMFEPGNPVACAQAINRLLCDHGLADKLARQGRDAVVRRYDWEQVGKRYCQLCSTGID